MTESSKRLRPIPSQLQPPHAPLMSYWALRLLIPLQAFKRLHGYPHRLTQDGALLRGLGLGEYEDVEMSKTQFLDLLRTQQVALERNLSRIQRAIVPGMQRLGAAFQLNPTEQWVLAFAAILHEGGFLDDLADCLGPLTTPAVMEVLRVTLNLPRHEVKQALSADQHLARSGLLRVDRKASLTLRGKLEPLAGVVDLLFDPQRQVEDLLAAYYAPFAPATLTVADYRYLGTALDDLRAYMQQGRTQCLVGMNVLLYGPPGTGKTELVKALAANLGVTGYAVSCQDEDGDPINSDGRMRAYQLAQYCLARDAQAVLLFDEMEDIFDDYRGSLLMLLARSRNRKKGYTNRLLETNPVPTFWITNNIDAIDPAFRRRFDLVLEMPNPPQSVRRGIADRHLGALRLSPTWLDALAAQEHLTPALLARAARVIQTIGTRGQKAREQQLERLIGGQLRAQGHTGPFRIQSPTLTAYRVDLLNPDRPLAPVIRGIRHSGRGRLCCYGPPGTGKTALARHLAEQLQRPLLLKRASDLLSSWVGETEQRLAAMFQQAVEENAVLLLDEADSMLRRRQSARASWEVTQVNELLTQMEAFDGVFVCATNLVEDLDEAAARRFDYKIRLDPLTRGQCWKLFCQVLREQQQPQPLRQRWWDRLPALQGVTPGDFAAVIRQSQIEGVALQAEDLYERLHQEQTFKTPTQPRPIGFAANL